MLQAKVWDLQLLTPADGSWHLEDAIAVEVIRSRGIAEMERTALRRAWQTFIEVFPLQCFGLRIALLTRLRGFDR